jgi:hypothetical protein
VYVGYQTEKKWYLGHVQSDFETSDVLGIDGKSSLPLQRPH